MGKKENRMAFQEAVEKLKQLPLSKALERYANGKKIGISKNTFSEIYRGNTKSIRPSTQEKVISYYDSSTVRDDFYFATLGQTHASQTNQIQLEKYCGDYKYYRRSPTRNTYYTGTVRILNASEEDTPECESKYIFFHLDDASKGISKDNIIDRGMVMRRDDVITLIGIHDNQLRLALLKKSDIGEKYFTGIKEIFSSRFIMIHESHPNYQEFNAEQARKVLEEEYRDHKEDHPGILTLMR